MACSLCSELWRRSSGSEWRSPLLSMVNKWILPSGWASRRVYFANIEEGPGPLLPSSEHGLIPINIRDCLMRGWGGGGEWYQSEGLKLPNFRAHFTIFVKDIGHLNSKKRFWVSKQLYVGHHGIKGFVCFPLKLTYESIEVFSGNSLPVSRPCFVCYFLGVVNIM